MKKVGKAIREVPIELARLGGGQYPYFVTSPLCRPLRQQVPVFMFHSTEPDVFESQMAFLRENCYQTLTLSAFMSFLRGARNLDNPSVLLTFDDGHKGWYEVAYPTLKRYGFHAVGFLVPTFIREHPEPQPWLSWPEVLEMERSGVFEFESHTANHDQIFISPQLLDFFNPGYSNNLLGIDTPWVDEGRHYTNQLRWGTPIYVHDSRYAGKPRYLDDMKVREMCVEWVNRQGGEAFFSRPDWRKALRRQFQTATESITVPQYESEEEKRRAIFDGLLHARQLLGQRLGRSVEHLCYPWGVGSRIAVSLSQEAGYVSNFWVAQRGRNINRRGDSPFYIPRLKDDYIFRLPGKGRKPLVNIFTAKMRRRIRKINIY